MSPEQSTAPCKTCGFTEYEITILDSGPHYAKKSCCKCGGHNGFIPKPENINKRAKNKHTPKSLRITRCQLCRREIHKLGSHGVLESHHIKEIDNGGIDEPSNIWVVCTSCHKLIHHQRTYLKVHFEKTYTKEDLRYDLKHNRLSSSVKLATERLFAAWEARDELS